VTSLLDLGEGRSRDPAVAGAKAARLATARGVGLPVLPGVVVPTQAGRAAVATATAALAHGGSGAARLAAMQVDIDPGLLEDLELRTRRLGPPVVVRSSSTLEAGGLWAGAFSSFEDVGRDDLRTALRGVWASAFTVHALQRCEAAGMDPASMELAVLVQPQVLPVCGGSAQVLGDRSVAVHATHGSPRDLMSGWESGVRARVMADGGVDGEEAVAMLGRRPLRAAADLARFVCDSLGDSLIEWAWTGRDVLLLQVSAAPTARPGGEFPAFAALDDPLTIRLARLAQRFPGPLGEGLVLPWALSLPDMSWRRGEVPVVCKDPVADLALAVAAADELTKEAWQDRPDRARQTALDTFAALRGLDVVPALGRLSALRPVDPARAARVVALLEGVARAASGRGWLRDPHHLWRHTLDAATALVRGSHEQRSQPTQLGPDRWEPFVHGAIRVHGHTLTGLGAVSGVGAGKIAVVRNPHHPPPVGDRDVVVTERPLPALAPLLWKASALVTTTGNPAAHLLEVADSLGVPAVLCVDLSPLGGLDALEQGGFLAAVDGAEGLVALASAQ
jgi:hypothetical protein